VHPKPYKIKELDSGRPLLPGSAHDSAAHEPQAPVPPTASPPTPVPGDTSPPSQPPPAHPPSSPAARQGWAWGLTAACGYLLVGWTAKVLACGDLLRVFGHWPSLRPAPPWTLPLLGGEDLAVALVLGALVGGLARLGRAWRAVGALLATPLYLYLAVDQLAYEFFFTHLDRSLWESSHDLAALRSSLVAALDVSGGLLTVLALGAATSLWLPRPLGPLVRAATWLQRRPGPVTLLLVLYLPLGGLLARHAEQYELQHTAPVEAVRSWLQPDVASTLEPGTPGEWNLDRTLRGRPQPPEDFLPVQQALAQLGPKRPLDIVLVILESLAWRDSSLDPANRYDTTPFLARLAADGLSFDQFHVIFPASTRSDFATMTGRYPYIAGGADIARYSNLRIPILADLLHAQGYTTAYFTPGESRFDSFDLFLLRHRIDHLEDLDRLPPADREAHLHMTWGVAETFMVDRALAWIADQRAANRPFFLQYKAIYPHHPYTLPPGYEHLASRPGDPRKQAYQASLAYADLALQRLVEGLQRLGTLERTVIVVTADHGEAFGELHPQNHNHGGFVYDESVRVPLVLYPGATFGGARRSRRVGSSVDLVPTLLEIAGVPTTHSWQGQSLVSTRYRERPVYLFSRKHLGVLDGQYKFILHRESGKAQLYDRLADPTEQRDLAARRRNLTGLYTELIARWQQATDEAYAQLGQETGETKAQRVRFDAQRRQEVFGERVDPLARLELCPVQGDALQERRCTAEPLRLQPGEQLAARLFWARPGTKIGRLTLYDPTPGRIEEVRVFDSDPVQAVVRFTKPLARTGAWKVKANLGAAYHVLNIDVAAAP